MNLIFFGIQGSGKGTQAKLLAENHGFEIFETGGELRKLAKEDSALGLKVKSIIESGNLVPTEVVMEIVENFLNNAQSERIIFDGIPRNLEQSEMLRSLLKNHNIEYTAVHFTLSEEEALKRLMKRAEIEGRADDNEESIKTRIGIFYEKTVPVIESVSENGNFIEIDASQTIDKVNDSLTAKLGL